VIELVNNVHAYVSNHFAELAFTLLVAGAVFVFALGTAASVLAFTGPVRRRVARMAAGGNAEQPGASKIFARWLPVAERFLPDDTLEKSKVGRLLVHAGYRGANALPIYYAVKALLLVAAPLLVLAASPLLPKMSMETLLATSAFAAFVGLVAPGMWLERRVARRQDLLRVAFPDALDLLVVCVEAGLGLSSALQRVADEIGISHPALGTELALVNAEMRAGVDRAQALKNLADRTGLRDVRGLVALLVQTLRFGTSIGDALRVYAEEFRDRRMQQAEEQAAMIGTRMVFPLVLCLFPCFFLVAVGPAIVRVLAVFGTLAH
jgi:tight adherence protein C